MSSGRTRFARLGLGVLLVVARVEGITLKEGRGLG